jgi:hypothetical protein
VPGMKVTPNAAMRARDVSRPRPEHLAEAEAAEARYLSGQRGSPAAGPGQEGGPRASRGAGRRDATRGGAAAEDGAARAQGGARDDGPDGGAGGGAPSQGGGDADGRRRRRITRAGRGRAAR